MLDNHWLVALFYSGWWIIINSVGIRVPVPVPILGNTSASQKQMFWYWWYWYCNISANDQNKFWSTYHHVLSENFVLIDTRKTFFILYFIFSCEENSLLYIYSVDIKIWFMSLFENQRFLYFVYLYSSKRKNVFIFILIKTRIFSIIFSQRQRFHFILRCRLKIK